MSFGDDLAALRPRLLSMARQLCRDPDKADDLVSDTVVRALRYQDRFVPGTNMRGWLFVIMRSLFLSQMRRNKWDGGSADELVGSAIPSCPASQGIVIELADTMKALGELPRDQREAVLIVGAGATYEEAAEELCCSIGTVKSRVARGRDALTELLA